MFLINIANHFNSHVTPAVIQNILCQWKLLRKK